MKRFLGPAVALLASCLLSSCLVTSSSPAASLGESEPVPEDWIGTWTVTQILGQPPAVQTTIQIEINADASLQLTLREGDAASLKSASLTQLGGRRILSTQKEDGTWAFVALEVDSAGTEITVRGLDLEVLKADVQAGTIQGEVQHLEGIDFFVRLTASTPALRTYLANRSSAFGPVVAILRKSSDGS